MFQYTKGSEVNPPEKQTYENEAHFFSPLGQYSKKSQKRKSLASVEYRMEGKKKKCCIVYPLAAEIRGPNAMSLHHPNNFKLCGTEFVQTRRSMQATNPPIQGRKNTKVICVQE